MPNAEINEICDVIRRGKLDKDNIHQLAAQKCIGTVLNDLEAEVEFLLGLMDIDKLIEDLQTKFYFLTTADIEKVENLCQVIIDHEANFKGGKLVRRGRGAEAATKICEELHQSYLNVDTYDQLARWCEMKRRMPIPEDHFRSIARILYGKALKRI
jgi:hypothetical protein